MHLVLGITYPLSQQLQLVNIDLVRATTDIKAVVAALERLRTEAQTSFPWSVAVQLAEHVGIVLSKPRVVGRQRQIHRPNADTDSVEEHYRVNLYIPFLDHILLQMKDRFSQEFAVVTQLFSGLRPNLPCQDSDIRDAVQFYAPVVDETRLHCELKSWNAKWNMCTNDQTKPLSAIQALQFCDQKFLPKSVQTSYNSCYHTSHHSIS